MVSSNLPLFLEGTVVKGFGRGSKELGCPTANYELEVVKKLPADLEPGVYYGWAQIDNGPIYKMVANIGWCPFYNNAEKSVETHVMHKFDQDFYGSNLRISILGYQRGEKNFDSLQALIDAIKKDIEDANRNLDQADAQKIKSHDFFTQTRD